jgi:hypothetical protein
MGVNQDSTSQPPFSLSFPPFFLLLFSFTVEDVDRLLRYFLITSSAAWEISHELFTFYTLNLNCKSA